MRRKRSLELGGNNLQDIRSIQLVQVELDRGKPRNPFIILTDSNC